MLTFLITTYLIIYYFQLSYPLNILLGATDIEMNEIKWSGEDLTEPYPTLRKYQIF